jgi:integrase
MPARKPTPVTVSNDQHEIKIYTTESHGKPLYQLSYYRGGKRERRSFADLNEAKREARIILGDLARDSIQAENLTAAEIESYTVARRVLAPLNLPVHVAAEAFVAARTALASDVTVQDAVEYFNRFNRGVVRKPMTDLVEEYYAARRTSGVSPEYLRLLRRDVGGFAQFTAGRMLPDLRARDLDDHIARLNVAAITKNGVRDRVLVFCRWAKGRGFLPTGWRELEGAVVYQEMPQDVTIFTPEEMERLLRKARRHPVTPFIAIGAFAGLRSAEIQRLDWKNVRLDRGFIEVRAETCKTRARRLVPISDNLRAWLEPYAQPAGPVTPFLAVSSVVVRLAKRAGMRWKKNALRHSYVSYRLALTNDGAKTALEAGHDQTILFRHYRELVEPQMAKKWFAIMPPAERQHGGERQHLEAAA